MPNEETLTEKFEGHTPGPWRAGDIRHAGRTRLVDHDGPRGFVAEVYAPVRGNEWDEPTRDANARLMAAAPDLLRERDEARRQRDALADMLGDLLAMPFAPGCGCAGEWVDSEKGESRRWERTGFPCPPCRARAALAKAGRP